MPYRGKRNEPAFVKNTAEAVARLKSVDLARLEEVTTTNFFRLFQKAKRPA
jgi:TatD DNase family protein